MAALVVTHSAIKDHIIAAGGHELWLPPDISRAFVEQHLPYPVQAGVGKAAGCIATPPHVGDGNLLDGFPHCGHCGAVVVEDERLKLHAVAGAEHACTADGADKRLLIRHCSQCAEADACSATITTPGSGHPSGFPGGFCSAWHGEASAEPSVLLSTMFLPLPPSLLRQLDGALRRGGRALAELVWRLKTSQGQQIATLEGTTGAIGIQDATSGHGLNAGALRLYSGSAPATANAAATGTKAVDQTLPAQFAASVSAATPAVITAGTIADSTILSTQTAGYGRLVANADDDTLSTTQRRLQLSAGVSATEIILNTTSLVSGGTFSTTACTITHGA